MKVVIACLNSKYIHMSSAPWCLAAGIREFSKSDISYTVMESTINSDTDKFADDILNQSPDVVSFCCYIWNISKTLMICEKIRKSSKCTIVLGGPEVAYRPKDVLGKYSFVDYVLTGEGEFCFPDFLDMLCGVGSKYSVAGLTFREKNEIISVPEQNYTVSPPSPFNDEYLNALGGRICYIESSRGCPYRCAFCLSGRVSPLRFFDIETTKRDIIKLATSGTQTVKYVDRTFNAVESHANEILQFIKENYGKSIPNGICFHFEIAGDILKESTMQILSSMPKGAIQLEIGMQSFNEDTLLAINRKTNTKKLIYNITRLISFGNMHIHIDLIAGLTGEDIKSFEKSFDIAYSLKAHMLQLGFLKLLYGADMREKSEKYPCEFSDEPPYEVISTPFLSKEDVLALKNCEDAVDRLYNSGRFLFTLDYLIKEVGFTPFKLFFEFGQNVDGQKNSLGSYAMKVYNYFAKYCDEQILKEKLLCDLLCCSSALQIPPELKIIDKRHKKAKAYFCKNKNMKVAILDKSGEIFVADHQSKKDFFGRFSYSIYDIDILNEM